MNLLRPLEREKGGGGGGGPDGRLKAAIGLWFGTEDAREVGIGENDIGMDSTAKVEDTEKGEEKSRTLE